MKTDILTSRFLYELGVRHSMQYLQEVMESLPYKNTLWSVQTVLKHFGVRSEGLNVAKTELANLTLPFVAKTVEGLALVTYVSHDFVRYISETCEAQSIETASFLEKWNGHVLLPKEGTAIGEFKEAEHRKKTFDKRFNGLAMLVAICTASIVLAILLAKRLYDCGSWLMVVFVVLLFSGLALSVLLLQEQLLMGNVVSQKLCGSIKNGNCSGVIHSKASRLPGGYNWSEIGMAYFTACLFFFAFCGNCGALSALSICTLPYAFWSISYQWFKLHQWCMLCVLVQIIIVLNALLAFLMGEFSVIWLEAATWGILFFSTIVVVDKLAQLILKSRECSQWEKAYKQLKYSNGVLETLCENELALPEDPSLSTSIVFGNRDAKYQVIIFGNLHCASCAQLHEALRRTDHDHCCIRYYFTTLIPKYEDAARNIIACYLQQGENAAQKALDVWYSNMGKGFASITLNAPLDLHHIDVEKELDIHRKWMKKNKLIPTPIVFINGRKLPRFYTVDDIITILP